MVLAPDTIILEDDDDSEDEGQQGEDAGGDGRLLGLVGNGLLPFSLHLLLQGVVAGSVLACRHVAHAAF